MTRATRALRGAASVWLSTGLLLLAVMPSPAPAADVIQGNELYKRHCAACHGSDGRGVMPTAPDLSRPTALLKPDPVLLDAIRAGRGAMPAYRGVLRDREILDIVAHLRTMK
jgi:cytochrome c6